METPQQQAIAANKSAIAQHQEAIRLAKQATWDIIAQQKAEAQAASQVIRQAIQEQRAMAQQNEEITHASSTESQESVNPMPADAMEESQTEVAPPTEEEAAVWQIMMPPSLEETITQLHSEAVLVRQQMQADILQTMPQKFRTEIDAD